MSREKPNDLLNDWKQETLSLNRAMGQVLQHVVHLYRENDDLKMQKASLTRRCTSLSIRLEAVADDLARLRKEVGKG